MDERKIAVSRGDEVTIAFGTDNVVIGINGESKNPMRHAAILTPSQARKLATLLNAAADLSQ